MAAADRGAALRVAYLIAPGRPLVVGAEVVDPNDYLREVVAAHARERIEPLVYIVDAAGPSASAAAALAGTTVTVLGPAPDAAIAQLLAEADFDAVVDLAGMAAATGPLLARRPARSVWTLDSLHAAHVAPLVDAFAAGAAIGADDALRAHRTDIEATLAAALAPGFSSAADCPAVRRRRWPGSGATRCARTRRRMPTPPSPRIAACWRCSRISRARTICSACCCATAAREPRHCASSTAAVRAAPAFVDARAALANLLRERERGDAAIAALPRRARRRAPGAPRCGARSDWPSLPAAGAASARAAFDRALSLQPGDAETHYNRGVALQVGKKRRARAERLSARAGAGAGPDGRRATTRASSCAS